MEQYKKDLVFNLVCTNQIVMNAYDKLDKNMQAEAFKYITDNNVKLLTIIGEPSEGPRAVQDAIDYVFYYS